MATQEATHPLVLHAAGASDVGQHRQHNEDFVLLRRDLGLYVLADGAGGHNAGDIASQLACQTIASAMEETRHEAAAAGEFDRFGISSEARRLSRAIHRANSRVVALSRNSEQHRGMGTTVVAVSYASQYNTLHVAHVGDSRCYRLRHANLEALTQDHSLLTDVLEQRPELDASKLQRLPKNVVTRALGMGSQLRVSLRSHRVVGGDRYLLCSDGLTAVVNDSQIATLLQESATASVMVEHLIALANQSGAPDNVAAIVICVEGNAGRALPAGRSRWEPAQARESDPELLILGIEDLDLAEHLYPTSDGLLERLGDLAARKKPE